METCPAIDMMVCWVAANESASLVIGWCRRFMRPEPLQSVGLKSVSICNSTWCDCAMGSARLRTSITTCFSSSVVILDWSTNGNYDWLQCGRGSEHVCVDAARAGLAPPWCGGSAGSEPVTAQVRCSDPVLALEHVELSQIGLGEDWGRGAPVLVVDPLDVVEARFACTRKLFAPRPARKRLSGYPPAGSSALA